MPPQLASVRSAPAPCRPRPDEAAAPQRSTRRVPEVRRLDLPDRSAEVGEPLGRCRARLPDGRVAAVPYSPADVLPDFEDAAKELLVVELRDSDGQDSWLMAADVDVVRVQAGEDVAFVPVQRLRALVNRRMQGNSGCFVRRLDRAVYRLCAPFPNSPLLLCLVPSADVLAAQ